MIREFLSFLTMDNLAAILVRAGLILFITWLVALVGSWLAVRTLHTRSRAWRNLDERRLVTLRSLVGSAVKIVVYIVGGIALLFSFGVPSGAILTALGLFSAGFGLGARPLINDYLAGMIFIFEDQYSIGDKVEILEVVGLVEAVELRVTRLRATSGELYLIPNGEVRVVRNLSRGLFSIATVKVTVATRDLSKAMAVLENLANSAQTEWEDIIERPEFLSLEGAISNHVELTLSAKAVYGRGARMRTRLMAKVTEALESAEVEIIN